MNIIIGTQRFIIANIYGFHGFGVLDFLDEPSELEEILSAAGDHLILVGDYNCPVFLRILLTYTLTLGFLVTAMSPSTMDLQGYIMTVN